MRQGIGAGFSEGWLHFGVSPPCYTLIMPTSQEFDPQPQLFKGFRLTGEAADKDLVAPAVPEPILDVEELPEDLGGEYSARNQENILAFKRPDKK